MQTKMELSAMRLAHWPEQDRMLWEKAQLKGGLFDDQGVAANWRPATCHKTERGYGTWLFWLDAKNQLDPNAPPLSRVTRDLVDQFIEEYQPGRSELTVATVIAGLADAIRAMHPSSETGWLSKLAYRMMNRAEPAREKTPRLVPVAQLLQLGLDLMERGREKLDEGRISGAQVYRDGLCIALLVADPIRLLNLYNLGIGRTLVRTQDRFKLSFSADEMKNHRPLEHTLPGWITPYLDHYLEAVRPVLIRRRADKDERWLWISERGTRLSKTSIASRVRKVTSARFGHVISPHLFRHCVATDIAINDPEHVGIGMHVLGQSSSVTMQKHYNQASSLDASRKLQAVLKSWRT